MLNGGGEDIASGGNPTRNQTPYFCEESLVVGWRLNGSRASDGQLRGPSDEGVLQFDGRRRRDVSRRGDGRVKGHSGSRGARHVDGCVNGEGKSHTECHRRVGRVTLDCLYLVRQSQGPP